MLKRTPFYDFHVGAGGRMVDFAGWEMPLLYRGIVDEHEHTRRAGSIFDVSHMGRLYFTGPDAQEFLNYVLTRNVADQYLGQSRYSLVCNENGGVLDDVIVSRDEKHWLVVCNASNRDKLVEYFTTVRRDKGFDFDMADNTESTAMVALQGPKILEKLSSALGEDLDSVKRYHFITTSIMLMKLTVFRSGYTGEDGVEIILSARAASIAIKLIGGRLGNPESSIRPAGLGARDTLRMEAGMPLYGHELSESADPLSAGLGWAVDLNKKFVGVEALQKVQHAGPKRKLVGLELEGKRIARQGTPILAGGTSVGIVTSGTFAPTVQKSIAMAYVDAAHATEGTALIADLKGTPNPATIVKLPFYKRPQ